MLLPGRLAERQQRDLQLAAQVENRRRHVVARGHEADRKRALGRRPAHGRMEHRHREGDGAGDHAEEADLGVARHELLRGGDDALVREDRMEDDENLVGPDVADHSW